MKKAKVLALLLATTLAVGALAVHGYGKIIGPRKTIVHSEASLVDIVDKNELVNNATAIVSGEVISSEVQDDLRGFPATDFIIKVDKVFKGNPGAEVEVRTEGGENAKMKYIPDEELVTFQVGEQVVLFLTDERGDRTDRNDFGYYVLGGYQGKFMKENGKLKSKKFTFDVATFEQELQQIEEHNRVTGIKEPMDNANSDGI